MARFMDKTLEEGYNIGCNEVLSDLKKQVHDKAVYPNTSGVDPYVNLKVFDAIINNLIRKEK